MKKIVPFLAVILLAGCGTAAPEESVNAVSQSETAAQETAAEAADTSEESAEESGCAALFKKIKEKTSLGDVIQVSENNILNRYGIDTADLEDYIFEEPAMADNADTLIIAMCKSADTADQVEEALKAQLENSKTTTENYAPAQFALYDKSIIGRKDNCVYWVVSEDPEAIEEIILSEI